MKNECRGRRTGRRRAQLAMVGLALGVAMSSTHWLDGVVQAQTPGSQGRTRAENVQKLTGKPLRLDSNGRPRAISAQEARETVLQLEATLSTRAPQRPARGVSGMVMLELEGAANRTVVARPREDGSFATLCVTTVDEAVDFLSSGLAAGAEDR
jgi:hypothetical protein